MDGGIEDRESRKRERERERESHRKMVKRKEQLHKSGRHRIVRYSPKIKKTQRRNGKNCIKGK